MLLLLFKLYRQTLIPYFWLFYLGILISEKKDNIIPFLKKFWYLFGIGIIVKSFVDFDVSCFYPLIHCILVCGFVISIAYAFPKVNIKTDISYGLYIYHMIVVNVFIETGYVNKIVYLLIVIVISILLASMSTVYSKFVIQKVR